MWVLDEALCLFISSLNHTAAWCISRRQETKSVKHTEAQGPWWGGPATLRVKVNKFVIYEDKSQR